MSNGDSAGQSDRQWGAEQFRFELRQLFRRRMMANGRQVGLTHERFAGQLAEKSLNIDLRTISNWVNGHTLPEMIDPVVAVVSTTDEARADRLKLYWEVAKGDRARPPSDAALPPRVRRLRSH